MEKKHPCEECLVRATCTKQKHCDMLYEYEKEVLVGWVRKEVRGRLEKSKQTLEEAWDKLNLMEEK